MLAPNGAQLLRALIAKDGRRFLGNVFPSNSSDSARFKFVHSGLVDQSRYRVIRGLSQKPVMQYYLEDEELS